MTKRLLFCILIVLLFLPVVEAENNMKSITIHNGLAGESVYRIFKSKWGVMWIGTTNGVSSYDGYQLKTYRVGSLRSLNKVSDIAQSSDGYIWVAAVNGVYKVDGTKKWLDRALPEINEQVSRIIIINDSIYVGTRNGIFIGSTRNGDKKVRHVWLNSNHISTWNNINDFAFDGKQRLYILTITELYWMDIKTGKVGVINLSKKLGQKIYMGHIEYVNGKLYIGTSTDGLFSYDISKKQLNQCADLGCKIITCISSDKDHLYVGTDGGGLCVISLITGQVEKVYTNSKDSEFKLLDNTVYDFYHDPSGVNFFGYFRQGLHHNYYEKPVFQHYAFGGLDTRNINVRSICIDGKVKVLGSRGGLYYIDEGRNIVKFFPPNELGGSIVTNVVKYDGQYYCCTFNGGVMRIDPETLTTSRFGNSMELRTGSFGDLKVSPDNELWMSGTSGVYVYNHADDSERHYSADNSVLPQTYCNDLLFDRVGRCWISTAEGLFIYDPADKRIHKEGFPSDFFNMQKETHGALGDKDNLFFYNNDGLFVTNEEMTAYKRMEGIDPSQNEYIGQVIYDKRFRHVWIATEKGMFCLDANMKGARKFSAEAGLHSNEFSYKAIQIDENGVLWTGTMNGLYYASLSDVENYSMGKDNISLDELLLNDSPMGDKGIVSLVRNHSLRLGYNWGSDVLSFKPVLQNFCDQRGLSFEYRIYKKGMGEKDGWILMKSNDNIQIGNLPMGMNTLQIKLAGENSFSEYQLYVVPSVWFITQILLIMMFLIIVVFAYRQRLLVLRQRKEMERVQRELEEAKRKYSRVTTSDDEQERLHHRIENYMRTEKPFLNNELKLSDVAAHLGLSTVKLSQLFSLYLDTNYYDYINNYRLEEFKNRLGMPEYKKYTLLALAEECGFKRSSFFATFKKVEGTTPTEYVKKMHRQ